MTTLQLMARSKRRKVADLVFVHGLNGDAAETWRSDETSAYWPSLLADAFDELDVWWLEYFADASRWNKGHAMFMEDRASNIIELVINKGLGAHPLFWICHSYGGLLVKSILRTSAEKEFDDHKRLVYSSTEGIIFLSAPHKGASLADFVSIFRLLFFPTPIIDELCQHNRKINDLYQWFNEQQRARKLRCKIYFETMAYKGKIVVPKSSASLPEVDCIPVDRNQWIYVNRSHQRVGFLSIPEPFCANVSKAQK